MADSRRKQMTRLLFKTALIELMQNKPFHKITIKEICDQADLNRTTFYLHYNDQQQLLDDIINELKEKTAEFISTCTYKGLESKLLSEFLDFVKENGVLYRTIIFNDTNGEVGAMIFADLLSDMYDKWPVFGDSRKNEYVYTYMIDGVKSIICKWLENNFNMSSHDLGELTYNLCYHTAQSLPMYPTDTNH